MLAKSISYTDYNGVNRTETFYFNLSKAECMEMETSVNGGFTAWIKRIVESEDSPTIMKVVKDFILKSIGERSLDGRQFVKSEEISTRFYQSEAYSVLLMELMSDAKTCAAFFNAIIPNAQVASEEANKVALPGATAGNNRPA